MRKKIILIFIFLLGICTHCLAKYAPPEFFDLVGTSDLVVIGTVDDFNESTFMLQISEILVGNYDTNNIEVYIF